MAYIREYPVNDELVIKAIPISAGGIRRAQLEWAKKNPPPKPPLTVSDVAGHTIEEENADDPAHQVKLGEWREQQNTAVMMYSFATGVLNKPPAEFMELQKEYFVDIPLSLADLKYLWLTSIFNTEKALEDFTTFILGSAIPTEEGIAQAEATFPSDSSGSAPDGMASTEEAGTEAPADAELHA